VPALRRSTILDEHGCAGSLEGALQSGWFRRWNFISCCHRHRQELLQQSIAATSFRFHKMRIVWSPVERAAAGRSFAGVVSIASRFDAISQLKK
jgi:hypothetical protein